MKNLIGLRKLMPAFGAGSLEFLAPANGKVLAYLRRYRGDVILCVANLSRSVQPVMLDLQAFEGLTPVEVLGYTEFPVISRQPYFLSLGPYGFYWFELHRREA
jgi:maltose alpha-D-glucosyltransferase/alpha-amylase